MSQQYVATAKKATAVSKSLVCHFTGADDLNLVIAKGARLEIRDITPEGLQHRLDVPLYGSIATMEAYHLPEENSDRLFILTERYQFCVLQYDGARQVRVCVCDSRQQQSVNYKYFRVSTKTRQQQHESFVHVNREKRFFVGARMVLVLCTGRTLVSYKIRRRRTAREDARMLEIFGDILRQFEFL